jgi:hypothetical protein
MKTNQQETITYIETPRSRDSRDMPIKLDEILESRMRAFMKARRVRRFTFAK